LTFTLTADDDTFTGLEFTLKFLRYFIRRCSPSSRLSYAKKKMFYYAQGDVYKTIVVKNKDRCLKIIAVFKKKEKQEHKKIIVKSKFN